ncbi:MAG TPA: helix-turn-helix transcriptional regulator [Baekduia sp.]|nr:helix-turn-helix transcriptional regulator [Baekduia sp.]
MTAEADLAAIGALLSDRTRATILTTLLNGGLTPASVLAERAGVSRSLASAHLRKPTDGGLIVVEPRARQRLYRLAGQNVADALEVLLLMAPLAPVQSLARAARRARPGARDHLPRPDEHGRRRRSRRVLYEGAVVEEGPAAPASVRERLRGTVVPPTGRSRGA